MQEPRNGTAWARSAAQFHRAAFGPQPYAPPTCKYADTDSSCPAAVPRDATSHPNAEAQGYSPPPMRHTGWLAATGTEAQLIFLRIAVRAGSMPTPVICALVATCPMSDSFFWVVRQAKTACRVTVPMLIDESCKLSKCAQSDRLYLQEEQRHVGRHEFSVADHFHCLKGGVCASRTASPKDHSSPVPSSLLRLAPGELSRAWPRFWAIA